MLLRLSLAGGTSRCLAQRLLLAGAFGATAALKLIQPAGVDRFGDHRLPWPFAVTLSRPALVVAAVLELLLALLLISSRWRMGIRLATLVVAGLWALLLGLSLSGVDPGRCGCFGRLPVPGIWHFAFLAGLASIALSCREGRDTPTGRAGDGEAPPGRLG
ncbi:MAG: MauE/DoxX family redox-associated membrane protein [Planctomycetota bacterium]